MNATTIPSPLYSLAPTGSPRAAALHAEWTKLRTLRSAWMTMAISVVASVSLAALAARQQRARLSGMTADERLAFDPVAVSLIGVLFGALVLGALGVRTMSSEYSTGMIRSTAAAIPRRTRFLWSKVTVVAGTTFLVAMFANLTGFLIGQAALTRRGSRRVGHRRWQHQGDRGGGGCREFVRGDRCRSGDDRQARHRSPTS